MTILQQPDLKVKPPGRRATARRYHGFGYNVMPLNADKSTVGKWKHGAKDWTVTPQTLADVEALSWERGSGIGAILGDVSGGLLSVDFDKQPDRTAVDAFLAAVGLKPSYEHLSKTPGGGFHVELRSPKFPLNGNGKQDRPGIHGGHIELRYRDMLITLPPSLHPSGARYEFANGDPDGPPASVSAETVIAAYDSVTIKPTPPQDPPHTPRMPELPSDAEQLTIVRMRSIAEAVAKLHKRGNKPGYYACPIEGHKHGDKDFLIDLDTGQIGGCQGKHAGQLTRWVDFCEFMGVDVSAIARDVAAEGRAEVATRNTTHSETRFARGLPASIATRLLKAHLDFPKFDGFQDQGPALLVWYVWQLLAAVFPDGQEFTAAELERAAKAHNYPLTRATIAVGLEQLQVWGVVELCKKLKTVVAPSVYRSKDSQQVLTKSGVGRPGSVFYRFLPIDSQLNGLITHFNFLHNSHTYGADIAERIQPEFGEDTPVCESDIAELNKAREPVYQAQAATRAKIESQVAQFSATLREKIDNIRDGVYLPWHAPAGVTTARDLRQKMREAVPTERREDAQFDRYRMGVSAATMSKHRQREGKIALTRFNPKTGRYSVTEIPKAEATPAELHAYTKQQARGERLGNEMAERRKAETQRREALGLPPETQTLRSRIIPRWRPREYVKAQFLLTPGARDLLTDRETGEVRDYQPGDWHALASNIRAAEMSEHPEIADAPPIETAIRGAGNLEPIGSVVPEWAKGIPESLLDKAKRVKVGGKVVIDKMQRSGPAQLAMGATI